MLALQPVSSFEEERREALEGVLEVLAAEDANPDRREAGRRLLAHLIVFRSCN